MRQLDCQGHFGRVVACLLILRKPRATGMSITYEIADHVCAFILAEGRPSRTRYRHPNLIVLNLDFVTPAKVPVEPGGAAVFSGFEPDFGMVPK